MTPQADIQVTVLVSPVEPSSNLYRFVVRNVGRCALTPLQVHCGGVLIADDFGLDTDHMPTEWQGYRPSIFIDRLDPGEEVEVEQACYSPLASYVGQRTQSVSIGYSLAGSDSNVLLAGEALLRITGGPSRMLVHPAHISASDLWIGLRPVVYLGLLGLHALLLIAN